MAHRCIANWEEEQQAGWEERDRSLVHFARNEMERSGNSPAKERNSHPVHMCHPERITPAADAPFPIDVETTCAGDFIF